MSAPALRAEGAGLETRRFTGVESVAGYRLTPEVAVRAGYRARRFFGSAELDHSAVASVVWWKRWN